jgi:dipeptidyl-peptidase-4
LAAVLGAALKRKLDPAKLPIDRLELHDDGTIGMQADGKTWIFNPKTRALKPGPKLATPPKSKPRRRPRGSIRVGSYDSKRSDKSPDGKLVAYVKDHKVYLRKADQKEGKVVDDRGTAEHPFTGGIWWSPDSKRFVVMRNKPPGKRLVHLVESSPKDQLQPKHHTYGYLKPGDPIRILRPYLYNAETRKPIPVDNKLFAHPWQLHHIRWAKDSSQFTFYFNQRGHSAVRLVAVKRDGTAYAFIENSYGTFVDYSNKSFYMWREAANEIIWMSERSGWNHLHRHHAKTGKETKPLTSGSWLVRAVDRVDTKTDQMWVRVMGIDPKQDPYHIHYARIDLKTGKLTRLTDGDGTHSIEYSPDRRFIIDKYSRVDMPPVTELRRASDGKKLLELERGDIRKLIASDWKLAERFVAKGSDGKTDIHGIIIRPQDFDPKKKYPIIESIYAGPHDYFTPKSFRVMHGQQRLAELGFIVVKMDGRGTNWRSRAFHDVAWKNVGDAGFPDRIAWMKAAAKKYPYMDITRVGIYGGSAGGQSAMRALISHGDFYKAASADCGCHDNRMDKIWWNEAWMGYPIGPHYAEQSNVTGAHKITGKLLLMVGELDKNVDPASTMQVVNALIKADKDFELIVFPGGGHGSGGSRYGRRRQNDFFIRSLMGVEPRRAK